MSAPPPTSPPAEASSAISPSDHPFRFLDLPRELRDRVYGYVLVYDEVVIKTQLCLAPAVPQTSRARNLGTKYAKVQSRSTFNLQIPAEEKENRQRRVEQRKSAVSLSNGCAIGAHELATYATHVMSYAHPWCKHIDLSVDFSLLSVANQVYYEAAEVFYKRNTFQFWDHYSGWPASVCLAFLRDRSNSAKMNMRSLRLCISVSFCDCHIPNHGDWTQLWSTIRTDLQLHYLELMVGSNFVDTKISSWNQMLQMPGVYRYGIWNPPRQWIADILDSNIKKVKRLSLYIQLTSRNYENSDELLANMKLLTMELRKSLLRNGEKLGDQGLVMDRKKSASWIYNVRCYDNEWGVSLL